MKGVHGLHADFDAIREDQAGGQGVPYETAKESHVTIPIRTGFIQYHIKRARSVGLAESPWVRLKPREMAEPFAQTVEHRRIGLESMNFETGIQEHGGDVPHVGANVQG